MQATGAATAVGRIGQALTGTAEASSSLQQSSRALIRNLTVIAGVLAVSQALINWLWNEHSLLQSLLSGIALAMAILPEAIPVILTVFLALGAWCLSKTKVLTPRVAAVEVLGAITVPAAAAAFRQPPRARQYRLCAGPGTGYAAILLAGPAVLLHLPDWSEADLRLVVFAALMLTLFLLIPFLRGVMGFGPANLPPLLAALTLAFACGLWLQALRWARARHLQRTRTECTH